MTKHQAFNDHNPQTLTSPNELHVAGVQASAELHVAGVQASAELHVAGVQASAAYAHRQY